jgi:hypothetical protein
MKSAIRYIYKANENKQAGGGDGNRLPENGQEDLAQG